MAKKKRNWKIKKAEFRLIEMGRSETVITWDDETLPTGYLDMETIRCRERGHGYYLGGNWVNLIHVMHDGKRYRGYSRSKEVAAVAELHIAAQQTNPCENKTLIDNT